MCIHVEYQLRWETAAMYTHIPFAVHFFRSLHCCCCCTRFRTRRRRLRKLLTRSHLHHYDTLYPIASDLTSSSSFTGWVKIAAASTQMSQQQQQQFTIIKTATTLRSKHENHHSIASSCRQKAVALHTGQHLPTLNGSQLQPSVPFAALSFTASPSLLLQLQLPSLMTPTALYDTSIPSIEQVYKTTAATSTTTSSVKYIQWCNMEDIVVAASHAATIKGSRSSVNFNEMKF